MQGPQFEPDPASEVPEERFDQEQMDLINSPEFWAMIERRRKERKIPWDEVKASLGE